MEIEEKESEGTPRGDTPALMADERADDDPEQDRQYWQRVLGESYAG